jgi:asparagine synthase (glutamine-hydrolysing)
MCGILGWISREPLPPGTLDRGLERLAPRGPDSRGIWRSAGGRALFGHTRLAILDPSPRGAQPFVAPDGSSAFMENGEIYNFRQLRARLESRGERFVSEGDLEVAQRWLDREGTDGVEGLEGMFALAYWSELEGRLLLARDRLGIKPLYYAWLPGGLAFASQPKALLALAPMSARLDPAALSDYLAYGYVPFDRCIFAGIRKLPAAHALLYEPESGRFEVRAYWRLERHESRDDPEELRERLRQAVSSHMVSDVPVGAFLSGGLDSTTIVVLASRSRPALPTFAVGYGEGDPSDVHYARNVARTLGTRHGEELLRMEGLAPALARCAEVYDEPVYDHRALAMLDLARMASRTVKVVLSGDGGDEVFGGLRLARDRDALRVAAGKMERLERSLLRSLERGCPAALGAPAGEPPGGIGPPAGPRVSGALLRRPRILFGARTAARPRPRAGGRGASLPPVRQARPSAHAPPPVAGPPYLPAGQRLALVDRSTMAAGLECRVPLLDRKLVEYAFSLRPQRLLRPGATKVAFREAVEPWVPEAVRKRPKAGFSPPFKRWVGGPERESALRMLEGGLLASDGVIDATAVRALVERGAQRRYNKLWLLLCLEAWYGRWIRRSTEETSGTEWDEELLATQAAAAP